MKATNPMTETSTTLMSGETMLVRIEEPPLTHYSESLPDGVLINWIWRELRDDLLGGKLKQWLYTPYALGFLDGQLVGSMAYFTPTDTRDVGVIEFVQTLEEQRGNGIASVLMDALIEKFVDQGGKALMLCTSNPIAGRLYENHGFWYTVGDGMRFLAPGSEDFDHTYFAHTGNATVREATWADLAGVSALYNHREPDWLIKDSLTHSFRDTRYESHFVKLMRRIEDGLGTYVVLENPNKRVVGAAAIERLDTYYEQHVATLGFRVAPAYTDQTAQLLDAVFDESRNLDIQKIQSFVADRDADQAAILESAGLAQEARLKSRMRDGDSWHDLLVYTKNLGGDVTPKRGRHEYYGGRNPWMEDRIAEGRR